MNDTLTLALPFFGLVVLGYATGRILRLLPDGLAALSNFVSYVALPALYFRLVGQTPHGGFAGPSFLLTTAFSTYCAFAIAFSVGALLNRGRVPEATIQGLAGSWTNSALLAPGLTLAMFGTAAAAPTALVFCFDTVVLAVVGPLMMVLGGLEHRPISLVVRAIGRGLLFHPIIIATVLGLLVAVVRLPLPAPIDAAFAIAGNAAAPTALFATGAVLATMPRQPVRSELPYLAASKLIIHPLMVYVLLSWVGDFPPVWVYCAVLIAALPTAPALVGFARHYQIMEIRSAAIVLGVTLVSLISLSVFIYLIGSRILPADFFP